MADQGNPLHGHKAELTNIMGAGFVACSNIGVAPLGEIWIRKSGNFWEARQHVQIMMPQWADEQCDGVSPFADIFCANYAKGSAATRQKTIELLVADRKRLADSLFAGGQ